MDKDGKLYQFLRNEGMGTFYFCNVQIELPFDDTIRYKVQNDKDSIAPDVNFIEKEDAGSVRIRFRNIDNMIMDCKFDSVGDFIGMCIDEEDPLSWDNVVDLLVLDNMVVYSSLYGGSLQIDDVMRWLTSDCCTESLTSLFE